MNIAMTILDWFRGLVADAKDIHQAKIEYRRAMERAIRQARLSEVNARDLELVRAWETVEQSLTPRRPWDGRNRRRHPTMSLGAMERRREP